MAYKYLRCNILYQRQPFSACVLQMRANITPKVQVISQKSQVILKSHKSYSKVTSHTQKSQVITQNSCHKSLDHTLKYFIIIIFSIIIIIVVVVVVVSEKICLDVKFTLKITKSILECRLLQICLAL